MDLGLPAFLCSFRMALISGGIGRGWGYGSNLQSWLLILEYCCFSAVDSVIDRDDSVRLLALVSEPGILRRN